MTLHPNYPPSGAKMCLTARTVLFDLREAKSLSPNHPHSPVITISQTTFRRGQALRRGHASGSLARAALPAALLATAVLCGCKKPEAVAPPPPVVACLEIKTSEVPLTATLIGQLDSPQNVEVRARVEAFVKETPFEEGKEVTKDQLMFVLDDGPYQERLKAAEGALAEARAALAKYKADVARLEPLFKSRAIPEQDLDNAEASVEVGEAGVQSAIARVDSSKLDLSYCTMRAPVTGLIGAKQVAIGDLVGKGEPTLLATISTLDPIWFYCNVSEVDFFQATKKAKQTGRKIEDVPLTLILPNGEDHADPGKFVFIDSVVNTKTGTVRVRAEFSNKEKLLRPGMFSRVRVNIGKRPDTLTVPERAIVELQGKSFVWLVGKDNKVSQHGVTRGEQVGAQIIIDKGLNPGDRIVVEGINKLREGVPVTIAAAKPVESGTAGTSATPAATSKE
jgi:membrane fusion protein (multidrug efflux system)